MTDATQALFPVTQADQDALEELDDALGFLTDIERPIVLQAFARHRDSEARRCTEIMQRITQSRSLPGDVGRLARAAADLNVATDGMEQLRPQRQAVLDALAALTPSALSGDAGEGE